MFKFKPSKTQIESFKKECLLMQEFIDEIKNKFKLDIYSNNNYSSFYFGWGNYYYRISTHHLPNKERLFNPLIDEKYRNFNNSKQIEGLGIKEIITNSRVNVRKRIISILENH